MSHPNSALSYLIIGCGHFGSRAAEKLFEENPHSKIIIVDKNKRSLQEASRLPIETAVSDGTFYLSQFLSKERKADYLIPAVPFHFVFEFILVQTRPFGAKRGKVPVLSGLPNPIMGKNGDLYTSFANFLCPEDCPEPARYCTVTRKRREKPLYDILANLQGPFESKVIRSEQLSRGVGGFRMKALLALLEELKSGRTSDRPFLISTACRCHGVTSRLSFGSNQT